MNVLSPFDETVRDLSLAQHLPRIKKLLVYVCTYHWESDATGLASYHLHELIQQLVVIAPTSEALKTHLNSMIQTLNKPGEYTLVANMIVRHLHPLYPDAAVHVSSHYQSLYRIAAEQLAVDEDQARIKKLLHFVCRGQWTQDLDQVKLLDLLAELHGLTPTEQELTNILDSVVQNVSKPQKYRAIAQRIINALSPLYRLASSIATISPSSPATQDSSELTLLQQPSGQAVVNPVSHTIANPHILQPSVGDRISDSQPLPATAKAQQPTSQPVAEVQKTAVMSMRKRVSTLTMDDWFTMRIEIHKFTNPLLAKYLLFMNSYADAVGGNQDSQPGRWDRMTWDALKNTDIDTLLRDSLKSCRNIGEFERSLKRTTRQLNPPNQYKPVISAILRAVQPLFANCTAKENMAQSVAMTSSLGVPTHARRRSPSSPSSQPLPSHQRHAAEKHTLIEVNKSFPQKAAASEVPTQVSSVRLEQTEADSQFENTETDSQFDNTETDSQFDKTETDSQFDNTEAEITEQSQNYQHSSHSVQDETAFLIEQDIKLEQQRDTALLTAQTEKPGTPFDPFEIETTKDDSADETIAMPMH